MDSVRNDDHDTHFAYALKDAYNVLEITNMEDGNDELDVGIVPHAVHGVKAARLAKGILLCSPLICA